MEIDHEQDASQQEEGLSLAAIDEFLKEQGFSDIDVDVSSPTSAEGLDVLPTSIYMLALKRVVPITDCKNLKVRVDKDGRRRLRGEYTFTNEKGELVTYKVSQFIKSIPSPDGAISKKRKRSPKKPKVEGDASLPKESIEESVARLLKECASVKRQLNKQQKKKAKVDAIVPAEIVVPALVEA
jgi:hypothetical protein